MSISKGQLMLSVARRWWWLPALVGAAVVVRLLTGLDAEAPSSGESATPTVMDAEAPGESRRAGAGDRHGSTDGPILGTNLWRVPRAEWLQVSDDGRLVLVAPTYGDATLIDVASGKELRAIPCRDRFALSGDGKVVACGAGGWGDDAKLAVHDAQTGDQRRTLTLRGRPKALAISRDGGVIAAAGEGGVEVFDARTGARTLSLLEGEATVRALALLEGGDTLRLVTGDENGESTIWSVGTGEALHALKHREKPISALSATPDGARVVSVDTAGRVRVFESSTGQRLQSFQTESSYRIDGLAITADGSRVVTGQHGGELTLWDTAKRERVALLLSDPFSATAVAVTADGKTVLGAGYAGVVRRWSAVDGAEVVSSPRGHVAPVRALTVDDGAGRLYAAAGDRDVVVWDLSTQAEIARFGEGEATVAALALAPGGATLATGATDGRLRVWNTAERRVTHSVFAHEGGVRSLAWSPDGARLASGGRDGEIVIQSGDLSHMLLETRRDDDSMSALAWSPDGALLAAGDTMGVVHVLDAASGRLVARLDDTYASTVEWIGFSPDGATMATTAGDDVAFYDAKTFAARVVSSTLGTSVGSADWAPTGNELAVADGDGELWLLDGRTGRARANIERPDERIYAVRFMRGGKGLLASRSDTTVVLWDVDRDIRRKGADLRDPDEGDPESLEVGPPEDGAAGRLPAPECGPPRVDERGDSLPACAVGRIGSARLRGGWEVTSVAFSPDGRLIAAAGEQTDDIDVWDSKTGAAVRRLRNSEIGTGPMLFTGPDRLLACDSVFSRLVEWDLATGRKVGVTRTSCGALALSPDGKTVAVGLTKARVALREGGGEPRVIDVARRIGLELDADEPRELKVTGLAFSPDGARLAVSLTDEIVVVVGLKGGGSGLMAAEGPPAFLADGRLVLPREAGALVVGLDAMGSAGRAGTGDDPGRGGELDDDGDDELDEGGDDDGGDYLDEGVGDEEGEPYGLPVDFTRSVAASSGGGVLIDGETEVARWSAETPKKAARRVTVGPHDLAVQTGDPDRFLVVRDMAVEVWSWSTGAAALRVDGHDQGPAILATAAGWVLTADSGAVRSWDLKTGKIVEQLALSGVIGATADGAQVVAKGEDALTVRGFPAGAVRTVALPEPGSINGAALSGDGRWLAADSGDERTVPLFDLQAGKLALQLAVAGDSWHSVVTMTRDAEVIALARGPLVTLTKVDGGRIAVLDMGEEDVSGLAFSRDGKRLVVASHESLRVCSARGKRQGVLDGSGSFHGAVAFDPTGRWLVSGDIYGVLFVWDAESLALVARVEAHRDSVEDLAFLGDTGRFVTAGSDADVLVWDLATLTGAR